LNTKNPKTTINKIEDKITIPVFLFTFDLFIFINKNTFLKVF